MYKEEWFHTHKLGQKAELKGRYDALTAYKAFEQYEPVPDLERYVHEMKSRSLIGIQQEIGNQAHQSANHGQARTRLEVLTTLYSYKLTKEKAEHIVDTQQSVLRRFSNHPLQPDVLQESQHKLRGYEHIEQQWARVLDQKVTILMNENLRDKTLPLQQMRGRELQIVDEEHRLVNEFNGYLPSDKMAHMLQSDRSLQEYIHERSDRMLKELKSEVDILRQRNGVRPEVSKMDTLTAFFEREHKKFENELQWAYGDKEKHIVNVSWESKRTSIAKDIAFVMEREGEPFPYEQLSLRVDPDVAKELRECIEQLPARQEQEQNKNRDLFR